MTCKYRSQCRSPWSQSYTHQCLQPASLKYWRYVSAMDCDGCDLYEEEADET